MPKVDIYTKSWCPYCIRAKRHLDSRGVQYRELEVSGDERLEREMLRRAGRTSVPQIFIDGMHVGGSDDLFAAERSGHLDEWLSGVQKGAVI